jgi:hypothetical protein
LPINSYDGSFAQREHSVGRREQGPRVKNFLLQVQLDNHKVITFDIPAGLDECKAVLELLKSLGVADEMFDYFK